MTIDAVLYCHLDSKGEKEEPVQSPGDVPRHNGRNLYARRPKPIFPLAVFVSLPHFPRCSSSLSPRWLLLTAPACSLPPFFLTPGDLQSTASTTAVPQSRRAVGPSSSE
ncbi:hypothetical protein CRG98_000615 [Punica granatum]|uniref:Uncharacterized protein n=1 Tax=Punica granatum TaxID=22663 RepID=A0A2I0LE59_PUNGR|nr:hypothetical protein CRG98_000615 [Punica granatum]